MPGSNVSCMRSGRDLTHSDLATVVFGFYQKSGLDCAISFENSIKFNRHLVGGNSETRSYLTYSIFLGGQ